MALTNEISVTYKGGPGISRGASTLAATKRLLKGGLSMRVGSKIYPVGALAALVLTIAGVDANGGITVWSPQHRVRLALTGGTSQTLDLTSITYGASTIDISIVLGTDNANAVTTTANAFCAFVRNHGVLSQLLRVAPTGTGATALATASVTAVPQVKLMGWSGKTYGDAAAQADQPIEMEFKTGIGQAQANGSDAPTRAMIGGLVTVTDDVMVSAAFDPFALQVELVDVDVNGYPYIRVA